jgi:hypothetical protein
MATEGLEEEGWLKLTARSNNGPRLCRNGLSEIEVEGRQGAQVVVRCRGGPFELEGGQA